MFIVSQIVLDKSKLCNIKNISTYAIITGLIVYASIYLYLLFYQNDYLMLFNKFIIYIVGIDLLLSTFYFFNTKQKGKPITNDLNLFISNNEKHNQENVNQENANQENDNQEIISSDSESEDKESEFEVELDEEYTEDLELKNETDQDLQSNQELEQVLQQDLQTESQQELQKENLSTDNFEKTIDDTCSESIVKKKRGRKPNNLKSNQVFI